MDVGSRTSGETLSPEDDATSRSVSEVPPDEVASTSMSPAHSPPSSFSQPLATAPTTTVTATTAMTGPSSTADSGSGQANVTNDPIRAEQTRDIDPSGSSNRSVD